MTPPPDLKPPKILTWLVFFAVINAVILLILFLPFEPVISIAVVVVLIGVLIVAWRTRLNLRGLFQVSLRAIRGAFLGQARPDSPADQPTRKTANWLLAVEILIIVLAALWATGFDRYLDKPVPRLRGWESDWLTSSATFAAEGLRDYGYLPKWQPYLEFGEPLIAGPFSFVANPISAGPSLLFGSLDGIQISIVLYAILAGVGGWFLGRVLGLGTLARLLLGFLILGKGNMHAMIAMGYYQLGVTQAYFPWIIGGTLAIIWKPDKRWPVVLTALAFSLMFTAGNIWYTLPMLLTMALLALMYAVIIPGRVDWAAFKRLALAGALTLGLSAITLLPIAVNASHIGGHPDEVKAGAETYMEDVIPLFFNGDYGSPLRIDAAVIGYHEPHVGAVQQFYYTFVVPLWFFYLVFFYLPPIWPILHRPGQPGTQGIWIVGAIMIVLTTVWGVGGSPLFLWLYENIPGLGQWRFVGRALAVASFWIAILVAMRVDGLWRALIHLTRWRILRVPSVVVMALLTLAAVIAAHEVNANWGYSNYGDPPTYKDGVCLAWLRQNHPDEWLAVYRGGYDTVTPFLENRVRIYPIEADYHPVPLEWTFGSTDLVSFRTLPEYGIAWEQNVRTFFEENNYQPVSGSQLLDDQYCLYRKADAFTYAYVLPMRNITQLQDDIYGPEDTLPVTTWTRWPDDIAVAVRGNPSQEQIVIVQERTYPGWWVEVDGEPARLESVGGLMGVVIPEDTAIHRIHFMYRPTLLYLGAWITLLTCIFSAGYLLRAERLRDSWR